MRQLKINQQVTKRETDAINKYFIDLNSFKMISAEEEVILSKKIQEGDKDALHTLVKSNLRFVVSVAKQYQNSGEILDDLISAGNVGLIEAANRFDHTKGFKFISYAVWWIRQSIMQYLTDHGKSIRLPSNKILIYNKLKIILSDLEQTLERKPSLCEISDSYQEKHGEYLDENSIYTLMYCSGGPTSLDARISSDENAGTLQDLIQGEGYGDINKSIKEKDLRITILRALKHLSPTERNVITNFYGIGCQEKTLEEIGHNLGLTGERVRQIREKCIRKLKSNRYKKILQEYA